LHSANLLCQCFQAVLFDDGEELERHPTRLFCAGLPLLNRRFACIQVAGEDRLANSKTLAQLLLNLFGLERRREPQDKTSRKSAPSAYRYPP
jgi:hypothetical protein